MPKATETLSMHAAVSQMCAKLRQAAAVAELLMVQMNRDDAPMSAVFWTVTAAVDASRDLAIEAVVLIDQAVAVMDRIGQPKLRLIAG